MREYWLRKNREARERRRELRPLFIVTANGVTKRVAISSTEGWTTEIATPKRWDELKAKLAEITKQAKAGQIVFTFPPMATSPLSDKWTHFAQMCGRVTPFRSGPRLTPEMVEEIVDKQIAGEKQRGSKKQNRRR